MHARVPSAMPSHAAGTQRELEERAETAESGHRAAEELVESVKGQLEGKGSFDRRTMGMLERAEVELEHLRVQVGGGRVDYKDRGHPVLKCFRLVLLYAARNRAEPTSKRISIGIEL